MRSVVACFLLSALTARAAWDVGFDFRVTQSYVTDPSYATWVNMTSTPYPTTRTVNGVSVTFGWESIVSPIYSSDNRSDVDPRLAGVNCQINIGVQSVFRVDLPATGEYDVALAVGDVRYGQKSTVVVKSGNTSLFTIAGETPYSWFFDATGTLLPLTGWSSSNALSRKTFPVSTLRLALGSAEGYGSCVAHLRITQVPPAIGRPARPPFFLE